MTYNHGSQPHHHGPPWLYAPTIAPPSACLDKGWAPCRMTGVQGDTSFLMTGVQGDTSFLFVTRLLPPFLPPPRPTHPFVPPLPLLICSQSSLHVHHRTHPCSCRANTLHLTLTLPLILIGNQEPVHPLSRQHSIVTVSQRAGWSG